MELNLSADPADDVGNLDVKDVVHLCCWKFSVFLTMNVFCLQTAVIDGGIFDMPHTLFEKFANRILSRLDL